MANKLFIILDKKPIIKINIFKDKIKLLPLKAITKNKAISTIKNIPAINLKILLINSKIMLRIILNFLNKDRIY